MAEHTSCMQCRWLFKRDTGYSNYTIEDTEAHCVHRRNPALPAQVPDESYVYMSAEEPRHDWDHVWVHPKLDRWHATRSGRCELYEKTSDAIINIDVEGEDIVSIEEGRRRLLEEADPMPLLIAQYFSQGE